MTITTTRRNFLGAAAAGVLTGATALTAEAACKDPMPAKFDEMHDVLVVGSRTFWSSKRWPSSAATARFRAA